MSVITVARLHAQCGSRVAPQTNRIERPISSSRENTTQPPLVCEPMCAALCRRFRYGSLIYFAANSGSGVYEVDYDSLTAVLDRTGANKCNFTHTQCAALIRPLVAITCATACE